MRLSLFLPSKHVRAAVYFNVEFKMNVYTGCMQVFIFSLFLVYSAKAYQMDLSLISNGRLCQHGLLGQ